MNFDVSKKNALEKVDLSRKGSIDEPVLELVTYINQLNDYFTTSSCSGRICIYEHSNENSKKKGCIWLYTTHSYCSVSEVLDEVKKSKGNSLFKFEPFVLHVQCRNISVAQHLHKLAIESGFKNSGLSIGKSGKIISAIRCTHSLEVPLTRNGQVLVPNEYFNFLVELANEKMKNNFSLIEKFYSRVRNISIEFNPSTCLKNHELPPVKTRNKVEGVVSDESINDDYIYDDDINLNFDLLIFNDINR